MNFTRAAEELNITQPAVSHHIRFLEEQYEAKLFIYSGKKIRLTEAGRVLLSSAITMKDDELHLKKLVREQSGKKQRLVFGATMTIGEYVMPEALIRFLDVYPKTAVQMVVGDTRELLEQLNDGKIEFAVVEGFFQKKEYEFLVYDTQPFVAVCSKDYQFQKEIKKIEDLLEERLFIREKGSGSRDLLESYLEGKNLRLHDFSDIMVVNNIGAIKKMVEIGKGITFLYEAAIREELEAGILTSIPLVDFSMEHDFTFIWRKGSIYQSYYKDLFYLFSGGEKREKTQ
jgi:DNA-binding transcriptional LysR family regulator